MIIKRIRRKIYKLAHPIVGEIWMLHRVVEHRSEDPEQRELEVTPDWLEKKILEYQKNGYSFVSIDNISGISPFICLTLDDGYHDNYTIAYPLLKRLGIPFTIYVTTGFIDNQIPMWWYPDEKLGMSVDELRELDKDPLCTIGAHTESHPKLDTLSYDKQYQEIADSKHKLETLLGHEIRHFSFPHGAHNDDTLTICRNLHFQTAVQSWGGALRRGDCPYPLPRIDIITK